MERCMKRREFVRLMCATVLAPATASAGGDDPPEQANEGGSGMYGLVGKMWAVPGQRDALIAILLEGVEDMPGCLSYVVASDPGDADAIWIAEISEQQGKPSGFAVTGVREERHQPRQTTHRTLRRRSRDRAGRRPWTAVLTT